jgi:SsrA-binding protein
VKSQPAKESIKVIAQNKKARFNYHIVETVEAGIVLTGAEIKSIRAGGVSLAESYIRPYQESLSLLNAHINPYSHSGDREYDPVRPRKLLLHKREIDHLRGRVEAKGMTLVPLSLYLKNGRAKIEVALAKGKDAPDKRDTIRERESKREVARAIKSAR